MGASKDEIRELLRRYIQVWGGGDPDELDDILHPEFVKHLSGPLPVADYSEHPEEMCSIEAMKEYVRLEHIGLKGGEEPLAILVDGEWAAVLYRERGEHVGEFMAMPPTGKVIDFVGVEIYRIRDGRIAEIWTSNMWLETYRQLGWRLVVNDGIPGFERI